ncbi:MAG: hypothetical protein HYV02_07150 [Deltaproteobacteria bacterium]|nr:hypothetical protein [Deltaproteobacteria bacterium]
MLNDHFALSVRYVTLIAVWTILGLVSLPGARALTLQPPSEYSDVVITKGVEADVTTFTIKGTFKSQSVTQPLLALYREKNAPPPTQNGKISYAQPLFLSQNGEQSSQCDVTAKAVPQEYAFTCLFTLDANPQLTTSSTVWIAKVWQDGKGIPPGYEVSLANAVTLPVSVVPIIPFFVPEEGEDPVVGPYDCTEEDLLLGMTQCCDPATEMADPATETCVPFPDAPTPDDGTPVPFEQVAPLEYTGDLYGAGGGGCLLIKTSGQGQTDHIAIGLLLVGMGLLLGAFWTWQRQTKGPPV